MENKGDIFENRGFSLPTYTTKFGMVKAIGIVNGARIYHVIS